MSSVAMAQLAAGGFVASANSPEGLDTLDALEVRL